MGKYKFINGSLDLYEQRRPVCRNRVITCEKRVDALENGISTKPIKERKIIQTEKVSSTCVFLLMNQSGSVFRLPLIALAPRKAYIILGVRRMFPLGICGNGYPSKSVFL